MVFNLDGQNWEKVCANASLIRATWRGSAPNYCPLPPMVCSNIPFPSCGGNGWKGLNTYCKVKVTWTWKRLWQEGETTVGPPPQLFLQHQFPKLLMLFQKQIYGITKHSAALTIVIRKWDRMGNALTYRYAVFTAGLALVIAVLIRVPPFWNTRNRKTLKYTDYDHISAWVKGLDFTRKITFKMGRKKPLPWFVIHHFFWQLHFV